VLADARVRIQSGAQRGVGHVQDGPGPQQVGVTFQVRAGPAQGHQPGLVGDAGVNRDQVDLGRGKQDGTVQLAHFEFGQQPGLGLDMDGDRDAAARRQFRQDVDVQAGGGPVRVAVGQRRGIDHADRQRRRLRQRGRTREGAGQRHPQGAARC